MQQDSFSLLRMARRSVEALDISDAEAEQLIELLDIIDARISKETNEAWEDGFKVGELEMTRMAEQW